MKGDDEGRRRKGQKKGERVPHGELGFKAKVYIGAEKEYRRQRNRLKAVKYPSPLPRYGQENSKDCFMSRLRFTLNTSELLAEEF